MKHTKGPWAIKHHCEALIFSGNRSIASTGGYQSNVKGEQAHDENIANARRIVACVNACKGLSTNDIEKTGLVSAVGYQLIELEQQRDKLLNLCREVQSGQDFNDEFCKRFDGVIAEIEAAQ